jgi:hypothetical protein
MHYYRYLILLALHLLTILVWRYADSKTAR